MTALSATAARDEPQAAAIFLYRPAPRVAPVLFCAGASKGRTHRDPASEHAYWVVREKKEFGWLEGLPLRKWRRTNKAES